MSQEVSGEQEEWVDYIYVCLHMMNTHKQLERNVVSYVCHRRRDEGGNEGGARDDERDNEKLVDSCNAVLGRRSWNNKLSIIFHGVRR